MSSGTRSAKRMTLLAPIAPADPLAKLLLMCDRDGSHAYRLPVHGAGFKGLVDLKGVQLLCDVLRARLQSAGVDVDTPHTAMCEIDSICGAAATSGGLREWMERLRAWEQVQAASIAEGDDRTRLHMYASAVSSALVSRVIDWHGVPTNGGPTFCVDYDEEEFTLTSSSLASLSWMCALSGRYTYLGTPKSYIDPLALARMMSERTEAKDINALAMCSWRADCNDVVNELVPLDAQKFVHFALDQFAVCEGSTASRQGCRTAPYILAHSAKSGEPHDKGDAWKNAFVVGHRQLQAYDAMYGTDLAQRASSAWEGPDALNGKRVSDRVPFATTRLYFGRTFPLRILYDTIPAQFAHYKFIIWKCPRVIWLFYFASPLVFSIMDSVFCGYVPTCAKATVNHMVDHDGERADLHQILNMVRYGEAFYHSDSQPQQDEDVHDSDDEEEEEHSASAYELARARSIISVEVRQRLLTDRGRFRKGLRKLIYQRLLQCRGSSFEMRERSLAKW